MISVLLAFVLFAVLQVAALLYVRSVTAASAAAAARYAANANVDVSAGSARGTTLIEQALSAGMAHRLPCDSQLAADARSGLATARVRCHGQIRSIFLPLADLVTIDVTAESLKEQP